MVLFSLLTMNTLGERIDIALKAIKGTQRELARACGVTPGAVSQWVAGTTKMSASAAIRASAYLRVSFLWLTEGVGSMNESHPAPIDPGDDFLPITRVNLRLEAGVTGYQVQQLEGNGAPIFFRRDYLERKGWRPDKLFALKVIGDSMEPSLFEDDLVVVNSAATEPVDGEVFAINYEGQAVIKRLRRDAGVWWIDSDNPRHKPKRCDEHAILIGQVCYKQSERI